MDDTVNTRVKAYLGKINENLTAIETAHAGLIDFCIDEAIDRVCLYLNTDTIPTQIERILANVVNNGLTKCLKNISITTGNTVAVDQAISSISDNGQSISYSNEVTKYFTTASDEELFTGFSGLLSRYRRIKVVYPKNNEPSDS